MHPTHWLSGACLADVYLSNPRASNNRLNEKSKNRANDNRLFDSQNNGRGGTNVATYKAQYVPSQTVRVQFTQQHSCGKSENAKCDTLIEYMCGANVRDGESTKTIPLDQEKCKNANCERDDAFGMHEDYEYYYQCANRQRNHRLFTSNQKLKLKTALATRQNKNGERHGYECPEERDYWPYWGVSPWRPIALLTDYRQCDQVKKQFLNLGYCRASIDEIKRIKPKLVPLAADDCRELGLKWVDKSDNDDFFCGAHSATSRDNHHGQNGPNGNAHFDWTVPGGVPEDHNCVIRIRYNITTGDYPIWSDYTDNRPDIGANVGFNSSMAGSRRGYELKNDPNVSVFDFMADAKLELNVQTNQYGRTFQDRTHTFRIRPEERESVTHDITVIGERGNAVGVNPGVTIDMLPKRLLAKRDDLIHLHWSISSLERENRDKRWTSRQKEAQVQYNVTAFDWSKSPDTCFATNQYDNPASLLYTVMDDYEGTLSVKQSCSMVDYQHTSAASIGVNLVVIGEDSTTLGGGGAEALSMSTEHLEFSTSPESPSITITELALAELVQFNTLASSTLKDDFTGPIEIFIVEPANRRIMLSLKSDSDQAVVYYFDAISSRWSLLEPAKNGIFKLDYSHRKRFARYFCLSVLCD